MTNKDMFKKSHYNSLEDQIGGKHYRDMKIQPAEFINENKLLFAEGNAIKYICRHQSKGKAEDGIRDVAVTGVQTCALPISVQLPIVGCLEEPTFIILLNLMRTLNALQSVNQNLLS